MDTYLQSLLWRSFEGALDAHEQMLLDEALQKYPELALEKQEIEALRVHLSKQRFAFNPQFANGVTNRIYQKTTQTSLSIDSTLRRYFPRLALAGMVAIAFLMAQAYRDSGKLSFDTLSGNYEALYDESGTIWSLNM
jgi:hypothetical protein